MLVEGHDEARSTRGAGCLTTSGGSYGGPSLVRARSPEFARNAGCLATQTSRDPGSRTGSTPALVRTISIDRSKCSTGQKGTTSRVCPLPTPFTPPWCRVCCRPDGSSAPPAGRRGASRVHPGHGRRRCSASARRASCSGLFRVSFRKSVVLRKNVVWEHDAADAAHIAHMPVLLAPLVSPGCPHSCRSKSTIDAYRGPLLGHLANPSPFSACFVFDPF